MNKVDDLIDRIRREPVDGPADWDRLSYGLGRNDLPWLLQLSWQRLSDEQRVSAIGEVWCGAEYPEQAVPQRDWLGMFRQVGFVRDGGTAAPPSQPITLWRGGIKKTRMSWTADRSKAEWFQHRWDILGTPGRLYTATVEPRRLLADFSSRGESEYVINPSGLRIKWCRSTDLFEAICDE